MYHYAGNNPVCYTDPDGRCPFFVVTGIIGAAAGAAYGAIKSYNETGSVDWGTVGRDAVIGACIGLVGGAAAAQVATSTALTAGSTTASFSAVTGYGAATTGTAAASGSIWTLDKFARGWEAEQRMGGMMNNFPTIDKFEQGAGGIAKSITSIKSMDLACKTYQSASNIIRTIGGYADKVASFTSKAWNGLQVTAGSATQRILQVAIPGGATPEQMKALTDAAAKAAEKGVQVIYQVIE